MQIKDPETGKQVIKSVYKGSEIYSDCCNEGKPDIIAVMNEGYLAYIGSEKRIITENTFRNRKITADHHRNGFFAAYGKSITRKRSDADIYDIMPTILYLMGLPIPEDVDGRVLTEIINHEFVEKNEIRFEGAEESMYSGKSTLNKEEKKEVEKHLKNLGYLG